MSYLPQEQQPLIENPENGGGQLLPSPSSLNNNSTASRSYTTVLVVLAVIVAFSSIACFLGRFWGRRCDKPESSTPKKKKAAAVRPKEKESDIEFGFDHKKIRTANRPVRYGDFGGHRLVLNVGSLDHGNKHFDHGGPAFRFSDE